MIGYVISFLSDGFWFIGWFFPVYVFLRIFVLRDRYKATLADRISAEREVVMAGLFFYLVMLFTQTFVVNVGSSSIELVPLRVIVTEFLEIWTTDYGLRAFLFNIAGNIAVFIPIGFMFAYLFGYDWKKAALNGMCLSVFIEVVQIPLERTTDIDDVILNTSGTLLGCLICQELKKRAVCQR